MVLRGLVRRWRALKNGSAYSCRVQSGKNRNSKNADLSSASPIFALTLLKESEATALALLSSRERATAPRMKRPRLFFKRGPVLERCDTHELRAGSCERSKLVAARRSAALQYDTGNRPPPPHHECAKRRIERAEIASVFSAPSSACSIPSPRVVVVNGSLDDTVVNRDLRVSSCA